MPQLAAALPVGGVTDARGFSIVDRAAVFFTDVEEDAARGFSNLATDEGADAAEEFDPAARGFTTDVGSADVGVDAAEEFEAVSSA